MKPEAGPRWVCTVILVVVAMAVWSVIGPMWADVGDYHGEPYEQKFRDLGGMILLTLLAGALLCKAMGRIWRGYGEETELTPLQKEALAFDQARARMDFEYEEALRKVAEEAKRRGL